MLTVRDATGSPDIKVQGDINITEPPIEDVTDSMIVGPTERGPAFVPKELRRFEDLEKVFGPGETYTTYAAKKVLEDTDRVKVMRIMHERGWKDAEPILLYAEVDQSDDLSSIPNSSGKQVDSDKVLLSVIILSGDLRDEVDATKTELFKLGRRNDDPFLESFEMKLYNFSGEIVKSFDLSFDNFSKNYIGKILSKKKGINIFTNFEETQKKLIKINPEYKVSTNWSSFSASLENSPPTPIDFKDQGYKYAMTPWITSQTVSDGNRYRLFRFIARSAGISENRRFKISINEIGDSREDSDYGFFTVQVRGFTDNDFEPDILEEFRDVTLDPTHERYIARIIGDRRERLSEDGQIVKRGSFENQSDYIYVELNNEGIELAGKNALPYGFEGYYPPFSSEYLDEVDTFLQSPSYRYDQEIGNITEYSDINRPEVVGEKISDDVHLGFDFQANENHSWLNPIASKFDECFFSGSIDNYPQTCEDLDNIFSDDGFHLEDAEQMSSDYSTENIKDRKFSVGLQGGFDGANPYREKAKGTDLTSSNTYGFDLSRTDTQDYRSYKKALDILEPVTGGFQFNLLSIPGINLVDHFSFVSEVEQVVRNRGDAIYVTDAGGIDASLDEIIEKSIQLDTSYMATYFGWLDVQGLSQFHNQIPASSTIPALYVRNDNLRDPWIAPAGYNRGSIEDVQDVNRRLTKNERDKLYENNVNVLDNFNPDQILAWGQKTLYKEEDSALSQLSVRRLLVTVKSEVRSIARSQNNGITGFDVNLEYDTDFPNRINGSISISPIDVIEYILINFTLRNNSFLFV